MFGNKGSVGVAFTCAGAKLCFLNAHLAAHTEKVKQRNADYHRIVRTMFAPRGGGKNGKSSSSNMARRPKAKANAVAPADAPDETGALKPQTPIDPQRPTPETPSLFKVYSSAERGLLRMDLTCACSWATSTIVSRGTGERWTCSWRIG